MAERLRQVAKVIRTTALGALIAFDTLAATEIFSSDKPPTQADCPTVDDEILKGVYRIMDKPRSATPIYTAYTGEDLKEKRKKEWLYARDQAENYDLTLVDSLPFQEMLEEVSSVDELLTTLNRFTSEYGFSIYMPQEEDTTGRLPPYKPLSRESIDLNYLKKWEAGMFLKFFSYIPKELVHLSGMERMVLVESPLFSSAPNYDDNEGVVGLADYSTGSILINRLDDRLIIHEMEHLIDRKLCGTAVGKDSQLRGLNPKGFQYGEEYKKEIDERIVVNPYAKTGIVEEKAETMERIVHFGVTVDNDYQVRKSKFALLLARLEEEVPGITAYLKSLEGYPF